MNRDAISGIRFVRANAWQKERGIEGWASFDYGSMHLDGVKVRRCLDGHYRLGFPTHIDANGVAHAIVRPLDREARDSIEAAVISELLRRGLLPNPAHSRTTGTSRERGSAS